MDRTRTALTRRIVLTGVLALSLPSLALAHHGWRWTSGENIELTGVITSVKLGNPHGIITVDAEGDVWTVEVGQPWRNQRAGLKDGDLAEGVEIIAEGEPAADVSERRLKAERLSIAGTLYELYPERS